MIIHVFGKVQGPTSTGDLHDETPSGDNLGVLDYHLNCSLNFCCTIMDFQE